MHPFEDFLSSFIPALQAKTKQANQAAWLLETTGCHDAADLCATLSQEQRLLLHDPKTFQQLLSWEHEKAELSPLLQRELNTLIRLFKPNQVDKELLEKISEKESSLALLYTQFRATINGKEYSENAIRQILKEETNPHIRKQIWESSKQIGDLLAPSILSLVKLRNQAAQHLGYADFFQMQLDLQEVDVDALFSLLKEVAKTSDQDHQRAIEEIELYQMKHFNVSKKQLAPWLWRDPFAQEDPMEDVSLDDLLANVDFCKVATDCFQRMGFSVSPILAASDLWEREKKNQHAFCIHIDRKGDIRTLNNITQTTKWLETLLHELGHAIYEQGIDQRLPWLLKEPPHMIPTEAMALLAGRKAYQSEVLSQFADPNSPLIASAQAGLTRRQLLFSRFVLVMTFFEKELYHNPDQNLNALWWDLVDQYQKIPPPSDRANHNDWASKYHIGLAPAYYYSYLLGELLASQIEETIFQETKAPLLFQEKAGKILRERLFSPGNSMNWSSLAEHTTGIPLNSQAWIRQFSHNR